MISMQVYKLHAIQLPRFSYLLEVYPALLVAFRKRVFRKKGAGLSTLVGPTAGFCYGSNIFYKIPLIWMVIASFSDVFLILI